MQIFIIIDPKLNILHGWMGIQHVDKIQYLFVTVFILMLHFNTVWLLVCRGPWRIKSSRPILPWRLLVMPRPSGMTTPPDLYVRSLFAVKYHLNLIIHVHLICCILWLKFIRIQLIDVMTSANFLRSIT